MPPGLSPNLDASSPSLSPATSVGPASVNPKKRFLNMHDTADWQEHWTRLSG
jgi:hypothetical protein